MMGVYYKITIFTFLVFGLLGTAFGILNEVKDLFNNKDDEKGCKPACTGTDVCMGDCGIIKTNLPCATCETLKIACINEKCKTLLEIAGIDKSGSDNKDTPTKAPDQSSTDNGGSKDALGGSDNAQDGHSPSYRIIAICVVFIMFILINL